MKRIVKNIAIIFLVCMLILLVGKEEFASNIADSLSKMEYSDEFKEWLELSDEEKQKVIMPRIHNIKNLLFFINNII